MSLFAQTVPEYLKIVKGNLSDPSFNIYKAKGAKKWKNFLFLCARLKLKIDRIRAFNCSNYGIWDN
jgi:hypothetical protein